MPKQSVTPESDHPNSPFASDPIEPTRESGASAPVSPVSGSQGERQTRPKEYGGRKGLDPVRYGDWEKNGRCIDF